MYVLLWTYTGLLAFRSLFTEHFWSYSQRWYWSLNKGGVTQFDLKYKPFEETHYKHWEYWNGLCDFYPITSSSFNWAFSIEEFLFYVSIPWIVTYQLMKGKRSGA